MDSQSNYPFSLKFQQDTSQRGTHSITIKRGNHDKRNKRSTRSKRDIRGRKVEQQVQNKRNDEKTVTRWYRSKAEFYYNINNPSLFLMENRLVTVTFQAKDAQARLYMYGLDSLPEHLVELDDEGEAYLLPSPRPVVLYDTGYYPLIPGANYEIRVQMGDVPYYTPFAILSKQVSGKQLTTMKSELEHMVQGLAIDFVKKNYSFGHNKVKYVSPKLLMQFIVIQRHFPNVMASLSDLYEKVNFRIRKQYQWVPKERASVVDKITLRSAQRHPQHLNHQCVPRRTIDYDLPENQWVKYIIRNVLVILDEFLLSVDTYQRDLELEIAELRPFERQESTRNVMIEKQKAVTTLDQYRNVVEQLTIGFQVLVNTPWYQEVMIRPYTHIPLALTSDSRYRAVFQLYLDLQQENTEVTIDQEYTFQWKRTDKLYEMWGYIKILNILREEFHFVPESGWMFDAYYDGGQLLIPSLPSGTKIVMRKEELRIHYTYDGTLPLSGEGTDLFNKPLYMGKNNRPDARIDFYKRDLYMGSLLVDFKYKPINNVWREELLNDMKRSKEMDQLIAYGRDSRSNYLYGEEEGRAIREMFRPRPVYEAWAMYAEQEEKIQKTFYLQDELLRIFPFNPGMAMDDVTEQLSNIINRIRIEKI